MRRVENIKCNIATGLEQFLWRNKLLDNFPGLFVIIPLLLHFQSHKHIYQATMQNFLQGLA